MCSPRDHIDAVYGLVAYPGALNLYKYNNTYTGP